MRVVLAASVIAGMVLSSVSSLNAQVIQGLVLNALNGEPLGDVSVVILDKNGVIQRGYLTDVDGTYTLACPKPGTYKLRVGGMGFRTWDSPPMKMTEEQTVDYAVRLVPEGEDPGLAGFKQRMTEGNGVLLSEKEIPKEGGSSDQTLEEIAEEISSKLAKFGRFSLRITADWAHAGPFRSRLGSNASIGARHQIRDVSLRDCELKYTAEFSFSSGVSSSTVSDATIPLWIIDVGSVRVQRYELPSQLRATNPRWQVFLRAANGTEGFTLTRSDKTRLRVWEHSIPIDKSRNAEEFAEALRQAATLCEAHL